MFIILVQARRSRVFRVAVLTAVGNVVSVRLAGLAGRRHRREFDARRAE